MGLPSQLPFDRPVWPQMIGVGEGVAQDVKELRRGGQDFKSSSLDGWYNGVMVTLQVTGY